jgi:hypothetical protein
MRKDGTFPLFNHYKKEMVVLIIRVLLVLMDAMQKSYAEPSHVGAFGWNNTQNHMLLTEISQQRPKSENVAC